LTSINRGVRGRSMGTLQKLKAYFGMVPADDFDDYDAADDYPAYGGSAHGDDRGYAHRSAYPADDDYESYATPAPAPARARPRPSWAVSSSETPPAPVHGALAMETRREPVTRLRTEPRDTPVAPTPAPTSTSYPLGRIVTLHPTSYNEARAIGEHYREGTPVIMNLTEMDDADAKRLVDFAAGLAFALRGSIDKVTNKVFLISPPNVDPSAEDKRRIAEGGLFT
jgi:cell division inhibitor SepF